MPQRLIEPFCVIYSGYFLILNIFTDCEMMFQEVNTQLEVLKKDVNELKAGRSMAAEMDDLESLFFPVWRVKAVLVNNLHRSFTLPFHSNKAHYPHLVVLQDQECFGHVQIVYLQYIWSQH